MQTQQIVMIIIMDIHAIKWQGTNMLEKLAPKMQMKHIIISQKVNNDLGRNYHSFTHKMKYLSALLGNNVAVYVILY